MDHSPQSKARLLELDALRGIAAVAVMLFHFTTWYGNKFAVHQKPTFDFFIGYCGVHLFFMISGFVIFMTLQNTKKPMDFVWSRFTRLYPAYWTVIFLNLGLVDQINIKQFAVNLTMAEAWFKTDYVVPAFWTLTAELSFYALMLFLFVTKQLRHIEALGLFWLSVMMLNIRIFSRLGFYFPFPIETSGLLYYGHLFFAGILFYKIKTEGPTWPRHIALGLCLITQFLVGREFFPSPVMVAAFFCIFYLFCNDRLRFLNHKIFIFLGSISYSLYLIHENLGTKLLLYFDGRGFNYWLNLTLAITSSLCCAYLITVFIEQPALKYLRRKK